MKQSILSILLLLIVGCSSSKDSLLDQFPSVKQSQVTSFDSSEDSVFREYYGVVTMTKKESSAFTSNIKKRANLQWKISGDINLKDDLDNPKSYVSSQWAKPPKSTKIYSLKTTPKKGEVERLFVYRIDGLRSDSYYIYRQFYAVGWESYLTPASQAIRP